MAEDFCSHVGVSVDWVGEANLPPHAPDHLADQLDDIDSSDPSELSRLFGEDTVIFELMEPGRGGGHDGSACLVAFGGNDLPSSQPFNNTRLADVGCVVHLNRREAS